MPVQRTHKQSDLEKRMRLLNAQLYGKSENKKWAAKSESSEKSHITHQSTSHVSNPISRDTTFLRHDLTKIAILSSLAIGIQVALYFALGSNLLKIF